MSISSQIITVNSKYHHKCPYKKEAAGDKHQTSGGETLWRQAEGDVLCCQGAAITTTNSRRQGEDYPLSLQWKTGPAEPYFQTFGLQNCEIIHFYHYKPQICVFFFFVVVVVVFFHSSEQELTVVIVQLLSCFQLFATPCTTACQASLLSTISRSLLKFMSIESMMLFNYFILCSPLLLPPSIFSSIMAFSNESALHIRWSKYWSFSFSISLSNEYSSLISFRTDWLDLLAIQGTLKRFLQYHNSKTSILQCSAFSKVQISHPYMTTGKTIALTRRISPF